MDLKTATWERCLEHAAASDVGLRRANNQDNLAVVIADSRETFQRRGHLFLVADGMGAHAAGELASKMAADVVPLTYHKLKDISPMDAVRRAILDANEQIHSRGEASLDFKGMGTTCSTLLLLPQGALLAHVGDSRAYRLRGNRYDQLTFDHSLVWELQAAAELSKEELPDYLPKNIITRSLGPNAKVAVDLEGPLPVQVGDTFLLCSDGLSGPVEDKEMGTLLSCLSPEEAVRMLVNLANLRGGPDNITVIVARVIGPLEAAAGGAPDETPEADARPKPVHPLTWTALGVAGMAAAGAAAIGYWIAAMVFLAGAVLAGVTALAQRYGDQAGGSNFDFRPRGKSPYVSLQCEADTEFVASLAQIVEELRQAALTEGWSVDWRAFDDTCDRAESALKAKRYADSVRGYARLIGSTMEQLKRGRQ